MLEKQQEKNKTLEKLMSLVLLTAILLAGVLSLFLIFMLSNAWAVQYSDYRPDNKFWLHDENGEATEQVSRDENSKPVFYTAHFSEYNSNGYNY